MMPPKTSKARYASSDLAHPLQGFGSVPLAHETLDGVLSCYLRPGDKVSEWLRARQSGHWPREQAFTVGTLQSLLTDRINSLDVS